MRNPCINDLSKGTAKSCPEDGPFCLQGAKIEKAAIENSCIFLDLYITQIEENGNVLISEEVVAVIAEHALSEVEGAAGFNVRPGNEVADLIGVKNWGKGLKIMISEDNSVAIDCNILISYGYSVVDVAESVQTTIATAVESMTGVKVTAVNVNVCGIARQ